jgi:hypothetical protein
MSTSQSISIVATSIADLAHLPVAAAVQDDTNLFTFVGSSTPAKLGWSFAQEAQRASAGIATKRAAETIERAERAANDSSVDAFEAQAREAGFIDEQGFFAGSYDECCEING